MFSAFFDNGVTFIYRPLLPLEFRGHGAVKWYWSGRLSVKDSNTWARRRALSSTTDGLRFLRLEVGRHDRLDAISVRLSSGRK